MQDVYTIKDAFSKEQRTKKYDESNTQRRDSKPGGWKRRFRLRSLWTIELIPNDISTASRAVREAYWKKNCSAHVSLFSLTDFWPQKSRAHQVTIDKKTNAFGVAIMNWG